MVSVKELIVILLDCEMDGEIVVKDKKGKIIKGVSIHAIKHDTTLGCLFG